MRAGRWLCAKPRGLPRSTWGTVIAHAGVGVTVIGIAATAWSVEALGTLRVGDSLTAGPYEAKLIRVVPRTGPNYREDVLTLAITRGGNEIGSVDTMKRLYLTRNMPTTEAGIMTIGASQVYASVGEVQGNGAVGIRLFYKPMILLIWLGGSSWRSEARFPSPTGA